MWKQLNSAFLALSLEYSFDLYARDCPGQHLIRLVCLYVAHPYFAFVRSWWPHDMETMSALMALSEGNPFSGEFPSQRTVMLGFVQRLDESSLTPWRLCDVPIMLLVWLPNLILIARFEWSMWCNSAARKLQTKPGASLCQADGRLTSISREVSKWQD